jgi:acyl carrier protein
MTGLFSTRDGLPTRCPTCGGELFLQLVQPAGVALCPGCGRLFRRICKKFALADGVTLSTALREDLGMDSFDLVELVVELEEEFRITIPDELAKSIRTVGDIIAVVESLTIYGR